MVVQRTTIEEAETLEPVHGTRSHVATQRSALLNLFEIRQDRRDFIGLEDELGHVGMADRKAFRQCLCQSFNRIFPRQRSEGRRSRMRTGAGATDGVTARTVRRQQ